MSDLNNTEKRKFEKLLDMGGGYVLDFSNRTLDEFVIDSIGRSLYDQRCAYGSGSKANQIRGFWKVEANHVVGKLMGDVLDYAVGTGRVIRDTEWYKECEKIILRLKQGGPVHDLDALTSLSDERDFEVVAKAVREAIDRNEPESGLDRLHTFVMKYVRILCTEHGVPVVRDKPLHSIFGEYVQRLRDGGHIESEMAVRILKIEHFNTGSVQRCPQQPKPRS